RDGNLLDLRVNVSARQFASRSLVEEVSSALEDSGLSPDRLCLEITETTLMGCIDAALVTLKALQSLGVRFAIDDFGTGFGSLVYLRRLPINVIKIDRSFVSGLPASRVDSAIVSGIVGMAGALDIAVVAEGVESIDQQEALIAIGVRNMQGWLYARAMKQDALLEVLATRISGPTARH
ncbi:MAG: EAL domain-containing protein, partial [Dokdonella sp.]